ncbi:unnamed protein product, partial [marine sediment metagenome]
LVILLFIGCEMSQKQDIVSERGTVKYIDLDGGFYGIISDSSKNYDPINLSQEFQKNNLRVSFKAIICEDMVGIHMWGTIVEIVRIEKLD